MDRRTLLAIGLCFVIFLGWQKLYLEPRAKDSARQATVIGQSPQAAPEAQTAPGNESKSFKSAKPTAEVAIETKQITVSTGVAEVSNTNSLVSGWALKKYKAGKGEKAVDNITLGTVTTQPHARAEEGQLAFDSAEFAYLANVRGRLDVQGSEISWFYEDENVRLTRKGTFSETKPYIDFTVTADFKNKAPAYAFLSVLHRAPEKDDEAQDRQVVYWSNKAIERANVEDAKLIDIQNGVKWVGATSRYFLVSLINRAPTEPRGLVQPLDAKSARVSMVYPISGKAISIPVRLYFGPKELDLLRSVEPTLDNTVDFGWFTVIAYPLLKVMKWFYDLFHNYGVSIILLTVLVKLLTYPLTYKSMKSMKEMAKLQPQLQKLREKHKDNKEALNKEMLTMMKSHGYNPMAGCLPILIQMPVFFALYRVLYGSIELYQAPFMLWIQDLSMKDPYYVTPVLLTVIMFVQQKMTPNTATD
ncbi:MAG: hypothetical protein A3K03_12300, partial [Bdellovibrionales bacterium RIFOXYD1_FULL_44_7]